MVVLSFISSNIQSVKAEDATPHFLDLGITSFSCDKGSVRVGESMSFILQVTNKAGGVTLHGGAQVMVDADAENVFVGVTFPNGGFVSTDVELVASDDPSCAVSDGTLSLKNGKNATVKVTGYVESSLAHDNAQPVGYVMRPADVYEVDANNSYAGGTPNPIAEYSGMTNDNLSSLPSPIFIVNSAPELGADVASVVAGHTITGNLLANDTDVDGDPLVVLGYMGYGSYGTLGTSYIVYNEKSEACGSFMLNADGSFSFTADKNYVGKVPEIYYAVGDQYVGSSKVSVSELIPGMDTSRLEIEVLPNHAPVITPTQVSIDGSGRRVLVPISVMDVDGDPLTISFPEKYAKDFEVVNDSIYYVGKNVNKDTDWSVDITVSDGIAAPVTTPVVVTLKKNQAPILLSDSIFISALLKDPNDLEKYYYQLPLDYMDPEGDEIHVSSISAKVSDFKIINGQAFLEISGKYSIARTIGNFPYDVMISLVDEWGNESKKKNVVVYVGVVEENVSPNAYVTAHPIYYGDTLMSAFEGGADVYGLWSAVDGSGETLRAGDILPAGSYSINLIFTPLAPGYYVDTVKNVSVSVLPRPITISSNSSTKVYDGVAISAPSASLTAGSLVADDSLYFSNFASLTNVDTVENTFSVNPVMGTSLSNYDITMSNGFLMVTPRPITLTSASDSKIFDGTPLSNEHVSVSSGSLVGVDELIFSDFASLTDAGTIENTFTYTPAPGVSLSNYDIRVELGTLTVTRTTIDNYDIFLDTVSHIYDGKPYTPAVTVKNGSVVIPDSLYELTYVNNVNAGDSAMAIVSSKEGASYSLVTDTAYFSIGKRSLLFSSSSCSKPFDGQPLTCETIQNVIGDDMLEGDTYSVVFTGTQTEVGSSSNTFNVTFSNQNYVASFVFGRLNVEVKEIELSDENLSLSDTIFPYDGMAHCPSVMISVDGMTLNLGSDYVVSCSENVRAGVRTANVTISQVAGGNYLFNDYVSHFSIDPAPVAVTGKSVYGKSYDGTLIASGEVTGLSGVLDDDSVSVSVSALYRDANVGTNKQVDLTYELIGADRDNYYLTNATDSFPDGVITPLEVELLWSSPDSFVYDGTEKSVTAEVSNVVDADVVNVTSYENATANEVGEYVATAKSLDNNNYMLPTNASHLWKIVPAEAHAVISLEQDSFLYDGAPHMPEVVVTVGGDTLDDSAYEVSYRNNINAGDSAWVIVTGKGSGNYIITTDSLSFKIGKRHLIITSSSCDKEYDGEELVCETIESFSGDGIVAGEDYGVMFISSLTEVGSVKNEFEILFSTDNYEVEKVEGILTVNPRSIVLTDSMVVLSDTSFVYDATAHCPTVAIACGSLLLDPSHDFKVECENNVSAGVADLWVKSEENGNYIFSDYIAHFTITAAKVFVDSVALSSKIYDGKTGADVNDVYFSGAVAGDDVRVTATGTFDDKNVGDNKRVSLSFALEGSSASNYLLDANDSTLTDGVITPKEVSLVWSTPNVFVYDKTEKTMSAGVDGLISDDSVSLSYGGVFSATEAGDYVAFVLSLGNDNYLLPADDSIAWSILQVTSKPELTVQDKGLTYDKKPKLPSVTVTVDGNTLDPSDYSLSYENNIDAGDSAMVIVSPVVGPGHSYAFATDTAYFSIGKRKIVFISVNASKEFDGTPLVMETQYMLNASQLVDGDVPNVAFTGSQLNVGVSDNLFTVTFAKDNYDVVYRYGKLTVNPKTVDLNSENIVWNETALVYSGHELCPTALITVSDSLVMREGLDYVIRCSDNVNVGNDVATAEISAQPKGNFIFSDYSDKFSILPSVIRVADSTVMEKEFDGTTIATVLVNELSGVSDVDSITVTPFAEFDDAKAGVNKTVTIRYQLGGDNLSNYVLASDSAIYRNGIILPRRVSLNWSEPDTFLFDGLKHGVSATVQTDLDGYDLSVVSIDNDSAIASGTYVARVLSINNTNFALPENDSLVWVILRNEVDSAAFILNQSEFTYDAQPHPAEYTIDPLLHMTASVDYDISYGMRSAGEETQWTKLPPVKPGLYDVKIEIINSDYGTGVFGGGSIVVNKAPVSVVPEFVDTKVYDQSATVDYAARLHGALLSENVSFESMASYDTSSVDASIITFSYTLKGDDMDNYYLTNPFDTFPGVILPKTIKIKGTTVENKNYDGKDNAVASVGTVVVGVLPNDEVIPEIAKASFETPLYGNDIPVYVTYNLTGADAANYSALTDTFLADIYRPSVTASWELTDTCYGEAIVGVNPIALLDDETIEGSLSYYVDDVLVDSGYAIPVGYHKLNVVFMMPDSTEIPCGVANMSVSKRYVSLESVSVNPNKIYDGTDTVLALGTDSVLIGVYGDDDIHLNTLNAKYDNVVVGERVITFSCTLRGADTANYTVEDSEMLGKITKRYVFLMAYDSTKIYDGTPLVFDSVTIGGDGFVEGDLLDIHTSGNITEPGFTFNYAVFNLVDDSLEANYEVEYSRGFLVVEKIPQDAPIIIPVAESVPGASDGRMIGLSVEMEMRMDPDTVYTLVTNADSLFAPGTYYVRYPEKQYYAPSSDDVVVIDAAPTEFFVDASSADTMMGSVLGAGSYPYDSNVDITAEPKRGYHFVAWNDTLDENPYSFTLTKDTSFVASFAPNDYNLYLLDGGDTLKQIVLPYGTTITDSVVALVPEKTGFDFSGWSIRLPFALEPNDMSISAQWNRKYYQVTVDTVYENGKVSANFINPVAYEDSVVLIATPSVGYHFVAWNDGVSTNPRQVVVYSDTALSASFLPNEYTAYFMDDRDTLKTLSVVYGDTIYSDSVNLTPEKVGHEFAGWNPTLPMAVTASDMEFQTQWTKKHYIVSVDTSDAFGKVTLQFTNPVAYGDEVQLSVEPIVGYHFVSWRDGSRENPRYVVVVRDTTLSPIYAINEVNLLLLDDETVVKNVSLYFGDTIDESVIDTVLTKTGYDFAGWIPSLPIVAGDDDVILKASWTKKQFNLDIDSIADFGKVITDFENPVTYGDTVSVEAVPSVGYHFVSWSDGVTDNPRSIVVNDSFSLSPQFEPDQYLLIVLSDDDTLKTKTVFFGDTITEDSLSVSPSKTGYDLTGWIPQLPIVVGTEDVVVEAQWTIRTYIVSIDSAMVNGSVLVDKENPVAYGDSVMLTAIAGEGTHFSAWNDGNSLNPRVIYVTSDTFFSASFAPNSYNVLVLSEDDTLKSIACLYGDTITDSLVNVTPKKRGYNFMGWEPSLPFTLGASDTTIEAQWAIRKFNLTIDVDTMRGSVLADYQNPINYGDTVKMSASSFVGYHFVGWSDGNLSDTRSVRIIRDTVLSPLFDPNQYVLTIVDEGKVLSKIAVSYGDTIKEDNFIFDLEKDGYDFMGWSKTIPFVVDTTDIWVETVWSVRSFELSVDSLFENGTVTVDHANPIAYGDTVLLTVEPSDGYHFVYWNDGDTTNPRAVVVVSDTSFSPIFYPSQYRLILLSDGDTLSSSPVTCGDSIKEEFLTVHPEKLGYDFMGWSPNLPLMVGPADVILDAQWQIKTFELTMDTLFENGTILVESDSVISYGDTIMLTAVPVEGYRFRTWDDGDRANPRMVVVTSDTSFIPAFSRNIYYLIAMNGDDTMNVYPVLYGDTVRHEALDRLMPERRGHQFEGWDVDFPIFMPSHDTVIHAVFSPLIYTVVAKINGNVGSVKGEGDYAFETMAELTASPNPGYHFVSWGNGDTTISLRFSVTSDTIVSALFAKDIDELMVDTLIVPSFGYCPNTEDVIRYTLHSSASPTEYRILFSDEAKAAGFVDVDFTPTLEENEVKIVIPDCAANTYHASVQFVNADKSVTPFFDVEINVNLNSDYIVDIWSDVVSVINTENLFNQYQWFHNDVRIGGATMPYYCEKKGLTGNYYLAVKTTDGRQLHTCKKWFNNGNNTTLSVYPNPTDGETTVELSVDNGNTHQLVVTNASGMVVLSSSFTGRKTHVDFGKFASGTYVVEVDGLSVKEIRK